MSSRKRSGGGSGHNSQQTMAAAFNSSSYTKIKEPVFISTMVRCNRNRELLFEKMKHKIKPRYFEKHRPTTTPSGATRNGSEAVSLHFPNKSLLSK